MDPHPLTPDWAVSCMERINKFDDPDVLDAVLELVAGVYDVTGVKGDCAEAAMDFGYRKTDHCQKQGRDYLGLAS